MSGVLTVRPGRERECLSAGRAKGVIERASPTPPSQKGRDNPTPMASSAVVDTCVSRRATLRTVGTLLSPLTRVTGRLLMTGGYSI